MKYNSLYACPFLKFKTFHHLITVPKRIEIAITIVCLCQNAYTYTFMLSTATYNFHFYLNQLFCSIIYIDLLVIFRTQRYTSECNLNSNIKLKSNTIGQAELNFAELAGNWIYMATFCPSPLILQVADEGNSRNALCILIQISTFKKNIFHQRNPMVIVYQQQKMATFTNKDLFLM